MQAANVREQLCSLFERLRLPVPSSQFVPLNERKINVKRCLCRGFFMQSAVFDRDGNYRTAKDNQVGVDWERETGIGGTHSSVIDSVGELAVGCV